MTDEKQVPEEVSEYMSRLGKKSWAKRREKQGSRYFKNIRKKRRSKKDTKSDINET